MTKIGIFGGGQLARMMALEAWPMGVRTRFLVTPSDDTSSIQGLGDITVLTDEMTAREIFDNLGQPQVITVEREDVDIELLEQLKEFTDVYPDPKAIEAFQHRYKERKQLEELGLPVAPYHYLQTEEQLQDFLKTNEGDFILKSCTQGYDGKGQFSVGGSDDVIATDAYLDNLPMIAEEKINFSYEMSVIGARNPDGDICFYTPTKNHHENGCLVSSETINIKEADTATSALVSQAFEFSERLMKALDYVGVLAMECFVTTDNRLIINEIAPRVHNSGHWTLKGALVSQFENHIRAVLGKTLGDTSVTVPVKMVNILGQTETPVSAEDLAKAHVHDYGKEHKPGRKVGHVLLIKRS